MEQNKISKQHGPRQLPMVFLHGVYYYVDERLKQFREINNPHNFIAFDSEAGQLFRNVQRDIRLGLQHVLHYLMVQSTQSIDSCRLECYNCRQVS